MTKPKNFLVIMGDHVRPDALSCVGNPLARTPHLDSLAARSVRFENCFTQAPVCSPARHSLATGRYVHAHGVRNNKDKPYPGMVTIAHALQPLGYRRIQIGQMHWGDPQMDNGYESWIHGEEWLATAPEAIRKRYEWENQSMTRRTTAGPSPREREHHSGHARARRAIEQIQQAVAQDQPFLCWLAFSEPHPPFYPPRDIYERFDQSRIPLPELPPAGAPAAHADVRRRQQEFAHLTPVEIRQMIAGYYGMIELLDGYVGTVLEGIERLGIRDETAVIFTSDHGEQLGEHGLFTKFVMHEASVRVPLLIHVPGNAPGVRDELVEHVDVFPTVCEWLGAETPPTVHGRSLAPILNGAAARGEWRDAVFSQIGATRMIRTAKWKLNLYGAEPGELYDMEKDPKEFFNRIADPSCAGIVKSLSGRVEAWAAATSADGRP